MACLLSNIIIVFGILTLRAIDWYVYVYMG